MQTWLGQRQMGAKKFVWPGALLLPTEGGSGSLNEPQHFFIQNKRLLKVTGSDVHCIFGNISETVQDGVIVTTDH